MQGVFNLLRMTRRQCWSTEQLEGYQLRRLQQLVQHAYDRVPLHRRRMERAGVRPEDLRSLADLRRIPVLTRAELQDARADEVVATDTDLEKCVRFRTSGSTGRPLEIITRRSDRAWLQPSFFRAYLAWGARPWHRLSYLQARRDLGGSRSWYEHVGVFRRQVLLSGDPPASWIPNLEAWRPQLLHGYVLTLKLLAEAILEHGYRTLRVPLVVSTSGVLDDASRRLLGETLSARVVDVYASHEAGSVIAWECPECPGYHISTDTLVVEVLKDDEPTAPGEDGEVVITSLTNFTMPFIRYQQGDVARLSEGSPSCGRSFPLMHSVQGRSGDFVLLPSGRKLTPHHFFVALDHSAGVGRWQIVQESTTRVRTRVEVHGDSAERTSRDVTRRLRELLGGEVAIEVEIVDRLRRDASQKLRSVVSKIDTMQT